MKTQTKEFTEWIFTGNNIKRIKFKGIKSETLWCRYETPFGEAHTAEFDFNILDSGFFRARN